MHGATSTARHAVNSAYLLRLDGSISAGYPQFLFVTLCKSCVEYGQVIDAKGSRAADAERGMGNKNATMDGCRAESRTMRRLTIGYLSPFFVGKPVNKLRADHISR
jgi:hypothetical protein